MIDFGRFDRRPLLVAIAGPNGAGKSTFYSAHLAPLALPFINVDTLARELELEAYAAAAAATVLRQELLDRGESLVFETVFSDPVGDKLGFLKRAVAAGYAVVLCFIGVSSAEVSEERVAMRVSQGGHDVPPEKLEARYARTLHNLGRAIRELPHVLVYDNEDLRRPFRLAAAFESGRLEASSEPIRSWLSRWCRMGRTSRRARGPRRSCAPFPSRPESQKWCSHRDSNPKPPDP